MSRPKYIKSKKLAKIAAGDTPLTITMWDPEWEEFAALAPSSSDLTYANIRGAVKRNMRAAGYGVEWLEDQFVPPYPSDLYGVTFRFYKLPADKLPKQAPAPVKQHSDLPADFVEGNQLELELAW